MPRRNWTREELIVAFNLYCRIPFGKIHNRNPQIIELAKAIVRTPSALSWKLANFARLDPGLRSRNIGGAKHGARGEVEIWEEFNDDWEKLAFESQQLLVKMTGCKPEELPGFANWPAGVSREATVRIRINQAFFRSAVLAAYDARCCITGLAIPQLLTASHIVPWMVDAKNRTNPRNGLCLNALHDRAFDCGLLTVTPEWKVKLCSKLKHESKSPVVQEYFGRFEGMSISRPRHFAPAAEFLRYHNEVVFLRS